MTKPANKVGLMHTAELVERRALAARNSPGYPAVGTPRPAGSEERLTRMREVAWTQRFAFDSTQAPDALVAHVRICAGGAG